VKAYEFVEREKALHTVVTLCRVLGVSSSGYWAWRKRDLSARAQSDARLLEQIRQIHQASRGTYGVPRIQAELISAGIRCGRKRVARLMRRSGLVGCHRRRPFHTTQRDVAAELAPDLVQRTFAASAPNRLWIADITYIPTRREGFMYLAVILDAFSRRVVGWSMAEHLRAELVVGALEMAVWNRRPREGVIHHSDHGCQYTSLLFGERCQAAGISCSMIVTTTPWRRASLLPWSASYSPVTLSLRILRPAARSSSTSKSSITAAGVTRRSATSHQRTLKGENEAERRLLPNV
jgi:putative transposase